MQDIKYFVKYLIDGDSEQIEGPYSYEHALFRRDEIYDLEAIYVLIQEENENYQSE